MTKDEGEIIKSLLKRAKDTLSEMNDLKNNSTPEMDIVSKEINHIMDVIKDNNDRIFNQYENKNTYLNINRNLIVNLSSSIILMISRCSSTPILNLTSEVFSDIEHCIDENRRRSNG